MNPLIQLKKATPLFLAVFVLVCLAVSHRAQAVVPAPDGGYPGGNTAEGERALLSLTSGGYNTAVGLFSLRSNTSGSLNTGLGAGTLFANTGNQNTATGLGALFSNTTASGNTADGAFALFSNTTGVGNTATGLQALFSNAGGIRNTANGVYALNHNVSGGGNTAVGYQALANNTADGNTATGNDALVSNTIGFDNTANGTGALQNNTIGSANTANGFHALFSSTTSAANTAYGFEALFSNTDGVGNTANGAQALYTNTTGNNNTAEGFNALVNNTQGSDNTAIGKFAGQNITGTGSGNVCIGADVTGNALDSNTTRIKNIGSTPQDTGIYVTLDQVGGTKLGYFNLGSSRRFKEDIKPMGKASEALFALKPVNFRYKQKFDPDRARRFGLIAEEVEKVNPDLVARDGEGNINTVRYEAVNAMLLNEFLKEHRKVEQLTKDFESKLAKQQNQIEALTAGLQKVSAQVEMSRIAPQMVVTEQ